MTVDIEWENDFDSGTLGLWTYDAVGNNNIEINSNAALVGGSDSVTLARSTTLTDRRSTQTSR